LVTGLHEIETLIEGADIRVALDRAGEPRRLPAVVDRSAYRVVREALDAAACASEATVAIEFVPGAIVVQVEDDCANPRDLEALEDLAAALGGGLKAAPSRHGFRVRAWLPTEGQPPSPAAPRAVH
jgi:signal transduction histidine kinase